MDDKKNNKNQLPNHVGLYERLKKRKEATNTVSSAEQIWGGNAVNGSKK